MGISKTDPKIVLVVQEDGFVIKLEFATITFETIFVLSDIGLVVVVVDDWRNQIVRAVQHQQKSTGLFRLDFRIFEKCFQLLLQHFRHKPGYFRTPLVLNIGIFREDCANCKQPVRHLRYKDIYNLVFAYVPFSRNVRSV